jgi:CheY-like chemotaxis protein
VHADALGKAAAAPLARVQRARRGYAGERRRILVVDNEEPDRELLVQLLEPMGFELRTAASGHDCLDLLAAGYRPDVIFMDLAMPGIDGWETLRRIQGSGHTGIHLAIVSANAFDKGMENDAGILPEDFILKPVRHTELIDWLERRLALKWQYHEVPAAISPPAEAAAPRVLPDASQLAALLEVVNLGFYRGIMNTLAEIERQQPATAVFVNEMRVLARQFQFEAMGRQLANKESGHEQRA